MAASGKTVRTTCPYCGVGCGLVAHVDPSGHVELKGDHEHPANQGALCSKGAALTDTLSLQGRLLRPAIHGKSASWDHALQYVANQFQQSVSAYGPDSVGMYVSGQLLTEDYYVANKFMKGFVGSANIDTNSRLCMASTVAGHKRAFGSDTVPGRYEDLELADVVVLVGSNLAWCHPVLYQRLIAAKASRQLEIIVMDPRRTATCDEADLHLPLNPGTDVVLWNALLRYLDNNDVVDRDFVENHVNGFADTLAAVEDLSIAEVAALTGVRETDIRCFFASFANTKHVVTVFSQGVNQSSAGTDKVNAILNCHLATGRIGQPGMGPFSVTGQPNAMGGREVGGLANTLAAHMELDNRTHQRIVREFWHAPRLATRQGLKAIDMFAAVRRGDIRVLWIMATNPAASMPNADSVRKALAGCPCVIVSDVVEDNDTLRYADVVLPSQAWGEKNGSVTNSERCISRQRAFLPPPGETRADWWQVAEVACRMGYREAFSYNNVSEIWHEFVELTSAGNGGTRDLDLGSMSQSNYDTMSPTRWGGDIDNGQRFFGDGQFFTKSGKANMVPIRFRPPVVEPCSVRPFVLITGRTRDQWHTMTRTGKAPRLLTHVSKPALSISPSDASRLKLRDGFLAEISTERGSIQLPNSYDESVQSGSVFATMHWTDQQTNGGCIDTLVGAICDPISGQPEFKAVPVDVKPVETACFGYFLSEQKPNLDEAFYWSATEFERGWQVDFALAEIPADLCEWLSATFSTLCDSSVQMLEYHDPRNTDMRYVRYSDQRVCEVMFIAAKPLSLSTPWLRNLLGSEIQDTMQVLAGVPYSSSEDKGAIVCACEGVGQRELTNAIAQRGCKTIASLGEELRAGTNCGSCRPELARLLAEAA